MGKLVLRAMYDTDFKELEDALDNLEERFASENISVESEFWDNLVLIKDDENNEQERLNVIYQELLILKKSLEKH